MIMINNMASDCPHVFRLRHIFDQEGEHPVRWLQRQTEVKTIHINKDGSFLFRNRNTQQCQHHSKGWYVTTVAVFLVLNMTWPLFLQTTCTSIQHSALDKTQWAPPQWYPQCTWQSSQNPLLCRKQEKLSSSPFQVWLWLFPAQLQLLKRFTSFFIRFMLDVCLCVRIFIVDACGQAYRQQCGNFWHSCQEESEVYASDCFCWGEKRLNLLFYLFFKVKVCWETT